jgi:hypothetical protein
MVALRQMRMKRAADMLAVRTFSVEQIARAVGQDLPAREIDAGHFGQDDPDVVDVPKNAANGRGDVGR